MTSGRRRVGAHVSVAGGVGRALAHCEDRGGDALQVFASNPRSWPRSEPDAAADEAFATAVGERGYPLFLHAPYLVNLASPDRTVRHRSIDATRAALRRGVRLGAAAVVVHTGSGRGAERAEAVARTASAVRRLLDAVPGIDLALELTAGSGRMVAGTLEELHELLDACGANPRVRVCLDTCHLYAAGHDLRSTAGMRRVRRGISDLGAGRIAVVHVNDSRDPLGSRRDRHARPGRGTIGVDALGRFLRGADLRGVPLILETPGDVAEQRHDIALVRSLASRRR